MLPVAAGALRDDVTRLLGGNNTGACFLATDILRVLDLLDLPVPEEGAQALIAFFDAHDRLTEMLLIYRARLSDYYPEAGDLALQLENRSLPGKERESPGLRTRTYSMGGMLCQVTVVPQNSAVGALVRSRVRSRQGRRRRCHGTLERSTWTVPSSRTAFALLPNSVRTRFRPTGRRH